MRFPKNGRNSSKKINLHFFIFLCFSPIIFLIIIAFGIFYINDLQNMLTDDSVSRSQLIMEADAFYRDYFLAGLFCILGLILQVLLLNQFMQKILPRDLTIKDDKEDLEILNKVTVKNFDDIDKEK